MERLIFGILGVNLYSGRFGFCEFPENYSINEEKVKKKIYIFLSLFFIVLAFRKKMDNE